MTAEALDTPTTHRRLLSWVQEVAEQTIHCFRRHVPAAVPGIVFLSGGQTDEDATAHLNAMNAMGPNWRDCISGTPIPAAEPRDCLGMEQPAESVIGAVPPAGNRYSRR